MSGASLPFEALASVVEGAEPMPGQYLGRFCLQERLSSGPLASVWRARDERLKREVMLKLPHPGAPGMDGDGWLTEARLVAELAHPHLVPLFEAEVLAGRPVLVFEHVPGTTLAQRLRDKGPMAARDAVELMVGVVDALRVAHDHGVVHRGIQPACILLDARGRGRIADFGIAGRLGDAPTPATAGVPGYRSPEAARGEPPSPLMDVFGVGLVLVELLTGTSVLRGQDPPTEPGADELELPGDMALDDGLRGVLLRALALDPARRHDNAAMLRDALMQWLEPPDESLPEPDTGHGTLDFLLRRMRHKSDFPALSDRVLRIQRMAGSDNTNLQHLAEEILQDVALTQKLLRLVNSAHFRRDRSPVSTVSRAVALVGQAGIRNLALSLVLVEHMKDKAHAQRLKECFLRAVLAAQLAHEMCGSPRDAEEAFIAGMFYNLGPLLTEYYFPEEAQAVRDQVARLSAAPGPKQHPDALAEQVSLRVLGLGFSELGAGVARHWGLPDNLQHCMRRPEGPSPAKFLPAGPERLRWLAVAANEAADAIWTTDDAALPQQLHGVVQRHGRALGLGLTDLQRAGDRARDSLAEMAPALGLSLPRARLRAAGEAAAAAADMPGEGCVEVLAAGVRDVAEALARDGAPLSALLHMVLETIYRGLGCQRVVFCLRDASGGRLLGRFGLGADAKALSPRFDIVLKPPGGQRPDLFGAVCAKGADTLVPDMHRRDVEAMLPAWFRQRVQAKSMLLLPLTLRANPLGLIYADHTGRLPVGEHERVLLRQLRDQVTTAFQRSGS